MRKINTGKFEASEGEEPPGSAPGRRWAFLSTHGQVLLCLSRAPDLRLREIAAQVGLTERAVQLIVRDLEAEGYLTCVRVGRRNRYEVHADRPMRHPFVSHREIRSLLELLDPGPAGRASDARG